MHISPAVNGSSLEARGARVLFVDDSPDERELFPIRFGSYFADIVTVGPQTPLSKLARTMIDAHIHRVIVVDEERRPIGVVSSTDVLAAVAYADE